MTDAPGVGDRIADLVGEAIDLRTSLPDGRRGVVHGTHSAWGNPNRFDTGAIELRPDDEWVRRMRASDRRVVTALNGPFLPHYGYSVRIRHALSPQASPALPPDDAEY